MIVIVTVVVMVIVCLFVSKPVTKRPFQAGG